MNHGRSLSLALLLLVVPTTPFAGYAPPAHINYQGLLRDASERPLNGHINMVFRLFDADVGGNEILVHTLPGVFVANGIFNVEIGLAGTGTITDGSGPGVYTYLPSVFGEFPNVYLEVEVNGEILAPRTLIGSVPNAMNARFINGSPIITREGSAGKDFYVDAVAGNDDNNGLFPHLPKRTIGAALANIPPIITADIIVHIADGTYTERLVLTDHVRQGGNHTIHLQGNDAMRHNVVLDGVGTSRNEGLEVHDSNVQISGMTIQGFGTGVVVTSSGGWVKVAHCHLLNNEEAALRSALASNTEISDTLISGNPGAGIQAFAGVVHLTAGVEISDNTAGAIQAMYHGTAFFTQTPCTLRNNNLVPGEHSSIFGYGGCTMTNSACTPADPSGRCVP